MKIHWRINCASVRSFPHNNLKTFDQFELALEDNPDKCCKKCTIAFHKEKIKDLNINW